MKIFIILLAILPVAVDAGRVNITVYYESLCPFSRRFLVNQLQPIFPIAKDFIDVDLVPFGFTEIIKDGDSWNFKCQHGLGECIGNKLHACALYFNSLEASIEFIGCTAGAKDPMGSAELCARHKNLNWDEINDCTNGKLGSKLLRDHGIRTNQVKDFYGVPFIFVNEVHSAKYEHWARNNLLELVCSVYDGQPDITSLSACQPENMKLRRSIRSSIAVLQQEVVEPIEVSVFYECLCPYCKNFLVHQLYPTFVDVPEIFIVDLVPFGHANFTADGSSWTFQCQHGPQECIGNKIQSCILRFYPDNNVSIPLIHCLENGTDPVTDAQRCVEESGLDWNLIHECEIGEFGSRLLHDNGIKTQNQTDLDGVPWILVNGVHTVEYQTRAISDLKGLLCSIYGGQKPPNCSNNEWPPQVQFN